jgi:hypothetical protein
MLRPCRMSATALRSGDAKGRIPTSEHKFKIGQCVSYGPPGQRRIVYTILQKLPSEDGGEHRYRIKAADEPHERVVTEADLRDASRLENKS